MLLMCRSAAFLHSSCLGHITSFGGACIVIPACVSAVTAYFITAGACVLLGLTAKSNAKRATPMLVLLLLRFFVVLARLILNSGSWWASVHFLWMEVRTVGNMWLAVGMQLLCTSSETT